ncbi:MAG TPA: hypothetical protein VKV96_02980 [Roseiarcus sp.]|nr:hypothetical protein [Roseiarcus sp.]
MQYLAKSAIACVAGAAMLSLSLSPASAFTLSSPSLGPAASSASIEKARWGWRHGGWGWGPGAFIGGLAAGAIVGSALARPAYGPGYYYYGPGYYDPCWRWVAGPWGWHWARVC